MKRMLLMGLPDEVPDTMRKIIEGGAVYDSSCSPEARVYFIDKDGGYYLKKCREAALYVSRCDKNESWTLIDCCKNGELRSLFGF